MLSELQPSDFTGLPPLYAQSAHSLVVRSIAAGHTPARAWVDDPVQPQTALVWDRMSGLYLAGRHDRADVNQALHQQITTTILPDAQARWIPEMELFYDDETWEAPIRQTFLSGIDLQPARFNSYRLESPPAAECLQLPQPFSLRPVNRQLLMQHGWDQMDTLTGWILSFYASLEDFLRIGFGYVAVSEADQAIASLCISVFVADRLDTSGQAYELGLATAPEYRRRGLATAVAAACVNHCLERGDLPVWHCWSDNLPSIRVAERVGYAMTRQSPAYRFDIRA